MKGLPLLVPEREEHVEDPDEAEEEEEEVDEAEHALEQGASKSPPVPEHPERLVADGPHPNRHHAHRLTPGRPAQQRAVDDVEDTGDQEGNRREAPPAGPPPGHEVHVERVAVAEQQDEDHEHDEEDDEVDQVAAHPDAPGRVRRTRLGMGVNPPVPGRCRVRGLGAGRERRWPPTGAPRGPGARHRSRRRHRRWRSAAGVRCRETRAARSARAHHPACPPRRTRASRLPRRVRRLDRSLHGAHMIRGRPRSAPSRRRTAGHAGASPRAAPGRPSAAT